MLAHVEQVRHVHPHPSGASWEVIVLLVAVLAVAGVVAAWLSASRTGGRRVRLGRLPAGRGKGRDHG